MKTNMKWILAAALLGSLGVKAADKEKVREHAVEERRETKADIDKRIASINRLDNRQAAMRIGMAEVSKQTAVPLPKIEAEHKEHPGVGLGGLFMAHELAVHTQKPVEHFINAHKEGKSWNELATASQVSLHEIDAKLARVEDAMRNAK